MRILLSLSFIVFLASSLWAQAPVIQNIEPVTALPNDTIVISGTGFNTDPTKLQVWFESVKGQVIESSDYAIVVVVPPQARFAPIEVINLASRLSGKSRQKFTPSLPVASFSASNFTTAYTLTSTTEELWDFCTCDLDNDGKPEIATTKIKRSSPFGTPTDIVVLQNTGSPGTMSFTKWDKTNLPVLQGQFPTDNIVCGDLQGDGKPEMIVTRSGDNRNSVHIFRNTTTSTISFANPVNLFMETGHFATRMAIKDLNNDGKPEIIATNSFNDIFYIFINQSSGGTLSFNPQPLKMSIELTASEALTTYETDVQDFDGDNLPDIIINQFQTSNFYILKNISSGSISFGDPQKFEVEGALNRLVSADFNKDEKLDLVFTSTLNDNRALVLLNQSTEAGFSFSAPIELEVGLSFEPWGVDVGDIDGDRDPDIVVANRNKPVNPGPNNINIFLNDGATTPAFTRLDIPTSTPTRNIKLTDMDGDSKPDIVFTGFDEAAVISTVNVLRNKNCLQPEIFNETPLTICNGQTIRLQTISAENVTYTWSDGTTTVGADVPYLDITAPGNYSVTVTGESSCSLTSETIAVTTDAATTPADPVINGGDLPTCTGETLQLSTTATADEYIWTGPDNFTSSAQNPPAITLTSEKAGFYNLQIRVGVCKSDIVSKRIDVADLEDFAISSANTTSNILCEGTSVNLFVNDLADFTFQWQKDGVDLSGQTNATLTATNDGSYVVIVTPPPTVDCPVIPTDPFELTFLATPVASFTVDQTACAGETLAFTNTSQVDADGTAIYTWTFDDGDTGSDQNPSHIYDAAGSYDVALNVKYDGVTGCQHTGTLPVTVVSPVIPTIVASAEAVCPGEDVTLSIPEDFPSIVWSTTATTNSVTVTPGTYSVETTDVNGCAGSDDITIAAFEVPELVAEADPGTIPAGASSNLVVSNTNPDFTGTVSFVWTPGQTLSDSLIFNPVASPLATTTYTVVGTTVEGCTVQTQIVVTVEGVLGFPVAFSPNGDGQNEQWDIQAEFNPECTITIFDGRGRRVFEGKGENWDGTYQGKAAPEGTYFFVYGCPDASPKTGTVLLFR